MATISIIIPAYNVEKYIAECIDSIQGQSFTDWELIIVNDGSTDTTGEIIERYAANDSRIKYINVENGGPGRARNIGLDNATSEYIVFVDSDDLLVYNALEVLHKHISTNDFGIVNCETNILKGEHLIPPRQKLTISDMMTSSEMLIAIYKRTAVPSLWGKIYQSRLFDGLRLNESTKIGEDLQLITEMLATHDFKILSIPDALYTYRYVSTSLSKSHNDMTVKIRNYINSLYSLLKKLQTLLSSKQVAVISRNIIGSTLYFYSNQPFLKKQRISTDIVMVKELNANLTDDTGIRKRIDILLNDSDTWFNVYFSLYDLWEKSHNFSRRVYGKLSRLLNL